MTKQLLSFLFVTACALTSQSYGMQAYKNQYFGYNNTPDATLVVAGMHIGPNSRAFQVKNNDNDRIELLMPNNMRMAFNAPGHHSIALTKLVDQNEPTKLMYHLVVLNLLAAQVALDRVITPVPAAQAPQQCAQPQGAGQ